MSFREALIWIRNRYWKDRKQFFLYSGVASAILIGLGILADIFLPWTEWALIIRTAIALPTAIALFFLGYGLTLFYVGRRTKANPDYRTWRVRLSPTMRQRVSFVVFALLFVLILALVEQPGYTFVSSLILAIIAGLFTFMRKTSSELTRDKIGLPDSRDVALEQHLKERRKSPAKKKAEKEKAEDVEKTAKLEEDLERKAKKPR